MSHHIDVTSISGHVSTGVALGTGWAAYIQENATLITISISAASFMVALTFYWLNYRINRQRLAMQQDEAAEDMLSFLHSQAVINEVHADDVEVVRRVADLVKDRRRRARE